MPKIIYQDHKFSAASLEVITQANTICTQYQAQGFDLTLRQLYYQFVSRGLIPNKDTEYKRLGAIINDARLAGLLDWDYITDRTRYLRGLSHWGSPGSIIQSSASSYRRRKWSTQGHHVEVWVEKDALVGVLQGVCNELDVDYFSCRGYTSQSEIWGAAQRLIDFYELGKENIIIHLGDHDPSGIDMTRDIEARLRMFMSEYADYPEIRRIALNWDQVQQYNPPPNPAKLTDSRVEGYIARFGSESWELDALEPTVISDLIRDTVLEYRDDDKWEEEKEKEQAEKELLRQASRRWNEVVEFLNNGKNGGKEIQG